MLQRQPLQGKGGALNLRKLHQELVGCAFQTKSSKVPKMGLALPTKVRHPYVLQASALEEDGALRREDTVKKRAIRTVRSYDEFRHRVACAHLKPLRYVCT